MAQKFNLGFILFLWLSSSTYAQQTDGYVILQNGEEIFTENIKLTFAVGKGNTLSIIRENGEEMILKDDEFIEYGFKQPNGKWRVRRQWQIEGERVSSLLVKLSSGQISVYRDDMRPYTYYLAADDKCWENKKKNFETYTRQILMSCQWFKDQFSSEDLKFKRLDEYIMAFNTNCK